MGAASVLGGTTRMTLTLAAILVEITMDVDAVLPLMFTLAISKIAADFISPGFDDGMIHLKHLPFLQDGTPQRSGSAGTVGRKGWGTGVDFWWNDEGETQW